MSETTEEKKVKYTSVGSVRVIIDENGFDVKSSNSDRLGCVLFFVQICLRNVEIYSLLILHLSSSLCRVS